MPPARKKHVYAMGVPFKPTLAVPLDLFPHTPHCELVVLFERQVLDTADADPLAVADDGDEDDDAACSDDDAADDADEC